MSGAGTVSFKCDTVDEVSDDQEKMNTPIQDQPSSLANVERDVHLPWSDRVYRITMPAAIEPLLDLAANDPEQNLPYWAELWPSGVALADLIELDRHLVCGQRVFELGCGLGVTAIAAMRAGGHLTVSDYSLAALDLCRQNCEVNAGAVPEAVTFNWRTVSTGTDEALGGRVPVLLAADVLYERRDIEPLIGMVEGLLEPGGVLLLAEPGRPVATEFLARLEASGWRGCSRQHAGPWPDESDTGVVVSVHELRPPA